MRGESARPPKSLKARAIALLARREHSRLELREKLLGGHADDVGRGAGVEALLDELEALGYLSDARFAQSLIRRKGGAYSTRAIGTALKAHGVGGDAVTRALAVASIDDQDAMVALWRRRFGRPPADDKEKARQVRFLQSRGFALSAIFKLLRNPPADG